MTPAVFLFGIACALIQHIESVQFACQKYMNVQLDEPASIICKYSTNPAANKYIRKFCCREAQPGKCAQVVISTSFVHGDYQDRFSIDDIREEGTVVVTINAVQKSDEGAYVCGLGTPNNGYKAVIKLIVNDDSIIPSDAKLLYTELMGAVKFPCEFGDQPAEQRRYLCKMDKSMCSTVIDSNGEIDPKYKGRIIMKVDGKRRGGSFTVQMAHVKTEDEGEYYCGEGSFGVQTDNIRFELRISDDMDVSQGSRLLTSRLGGSVSAQCNYNAKTNYTLKFWAKWDRSVCIPIVKSDGYVNDGYEGRAAIFDDPVKGHMQVLMTQISEEDQGTYWCVQTDGTHDHVSVVELRISREKPEGLTGDKTITVKKGETAKLTCDSPCRRRADEKAWCRLRNSNCIDVPSNSNHDGNDQSASCNPQKYVLTIPSVSQKDNGWYWCVAKKDGIYKDAAAMQLIVTDDNRAVQPRGNPYLTIDEDPSSPSASESKSNTVIAVVLSVGAAVLIACAVFFIIRLKRKRNSDLVSIGSFRTNISMSELDNDIGKTNPAVIDTQETDISQSVDGPKIKKKGSQEDLDYSSFLIHHNGSPNEENVS